MKVKHKKIGLTIFMSYQAVNTEEHAFDKGGYQ